MSAHGATNATSTDHSTDHSEYLQNPAVITADWIGFLVLLGSSIVLVYKLQGFRGPSEQPEHYFFGYRESKMLSVYVNLFAAISYWLRITSHANGDVGGIASVHFYKYFDYVFTCPLLTIDLMWTLNLPYKFTFGANILCCILCATFAAIFDAPARYMWFCFGFVLFAVTWVTIVNLVRARLEQFYSTNMYAQEVSKSTKNLLKMALFGYFSLWCLYPLLYILLEIQILSTVVSHVLHVVLDVFAKSLYGFAMLHFQLSSEKKEFTFDPLLGPFNASPGPLLPTTVPMALADVKASADLPKPDAGSGSFLGAVDREESETSSSQQHTAVRASAEPSRPVAVLPSRTREAARASRSRAYGPPSSPRRSAAAFMSEFSQRRSSIPALPSRNDGSLSPLRASLSGARRGSALRHEGPLPQNGMRDDESLLEDCGDVPTRGVVGRRSYDCLRKGLGRGSEEEAGLTEQIQAVQAQLKRLMQLQAQEEQELFCLWDERGGEKRGQGENGARMTLPARGLRGMGGSSRGSFVM